MPVKMRARLQGVRFVAERHRCDPGELIAAASSRSPRRGRAPCRARRSLEHDAGAAGHAGQRVVGDVDGHLGRLGDAPTDALQERATAGEDDASIHDVGDELGRRLLDRVLDRADDLRDGRVVRLTDLLGGDLDVTREAREEVAPRIVTCWRSCEPG